jgi:hypothetical protein
MSNANAAAAPAAGAHAALGLRGCGSVMSHHAPRTGVLVLCTLLRDALPCSGPCLWLLVL